MTFSVLTLFPKMICDALSYGVVGRAINSGKITVNCVDVREFAVNKHGQVDDAPYGGGAGMVMMAPPLYDAYKSLKSNARVVYLTPQGKLFGQRAAEEFSRENELILLCGHYEGVDERVVEEIVTDEISIGDYVLTGGEPAAIVLIDAVARLVPGVLGKEESSADESFSEKLLEYPHYTRPPVFMGREVPQVLLSGHHKKIAEWRRETAAARTLARRPGLLDKN